MNNDLIGGISRWLTIVLFHAGWRSKPCWMCGFSKAAHHKPELEFDIDRYPCCGYIQLKGTMHND